MTPDLYALLPKRTQELVDVIGFQAALVLVRDHGGTHIYPPKIAKASHWLAEKIGMEAFEKLCAYYGGDQLEIDLCAKIMTILEREKILAEFEGGKTNSQLAREYGITERQIRRIKKAAKTQAQPPNFDLFNDLLES